MNVETEHFKTDTTGIRLRVGRDGNRYFQLILQKRPLQTICLIEEDSRGACEPRVRAVMELLEDGLKYRKCNESCDSPD